MPSPVQVAAKCLHRSNQIDPGLSVVRKTIHQRSVRSKMRKTRKTRKMHKTREAFSALRTPTLDVKKLGLATVYAKALADDDTR